MSNNCKSCQNCDYKRISGNLLLCAYSPKMICKNSAQIRNAPVEECWKVKRSRIGKCFNYENWKAEQESDSLKLFNYIKKTLVSIKKELKILKN
jgi:hypothetical protein